MNQILYHNFEGDRLHKDAYNKFVIAQQYLKENHPDLKFIVFDALRPRSVSQKMWDYLEGSPFQKYVADPEKGSLHNFGMAIDLSLVDNNNKELDMGTTFDDFSELSQPILENKFLSEGKLSASQIENRMILRSAMKSGGFEQLPYEWWHFNALPSDVVRNNYRIVE